MWINKTRELPGYKDDDEEDGFRVECRLDIEQESLGEKFDEEVVIMWKTKKVRY